MGKNQQEELRRLEEALMEESDLDGFDSYQYGQATQRWQAVSMPEPKGKNNDRVDVDMDAYSREVYQGHSRGGMGILMTMLAMVALSVCILIVLKLLGVL